MKSPLCMSRNVAAVGVALGLALVTFGATLAEAVPGDEYKRLPGYVDFDRMGIFNNLESTVDVFLKDPLIAIAREAVRGDDPELADMLGKIKFVRVQVFDLEDKRWDDVAEKTKELASELEKKGWEIIVRVREQDEQTYVYILPGKKNDIEGLVVMVIEDDEEATFVNIVGNIDPEQIGRLGRSFDFDVLNDIRINFDSDDDDDDDDKKEKKKKDRVYR